MKTDRTTALLEEIRGQYKTMLEAFGLMQDKMETLATQESVDLLTKRVDTIEVVVTETNKDLLGLDGKITKLDNRISRLDAKVSKVDARVARIENGLQAAVQN